MRRKRIHQIFALGIFTLGVVGLLVAWAQLSRSLESQLARAERMASAACNCKINLGSWTMGWGQIVFPEIQLGENFVIQDVRVGPDWTAILSGKIRPGIVLIDRLVGRVSTGVQAEQKEGEPTIELLVRSLFPKSASNTTQAPPSASQDSSGPEQIFADLAETMFSDTSPGPQRIELRGGQVLIHDETSRTLLESRGISFTLDKAQKSITAGAAVLEFADGSSERLVSARLQMLRDDHGWRVVVRRRKSQESPGWMIRVGASPDLARIKIDVVAASMPQILAPWTTKWLTNLGHTKFKGTLTLERENHQIRFESSFHVKRMWLNHPRLSSSVIGPIGFWTKLSGTWQRASREMTVEQGHFSLIPNLKDPKSDEEQDPSDLAGETAEIDTMQRPAGIELSFSARGRGLSNGNLPEKPWQIWARLQETPCNAALAAIPRGFAPALEGFQLSGTVSAGVEIQLDPRDAEKFALRIEDSHMGCLVTREPDMYSAKSLGSTFILKREAADRTNWIELLVGPPSQEYTPLSQVGRNVVTALVAAEDAAFWKHRGVDTSAIEQALRRNLAQGKVTIGGSTITMQTVKNLFLSHERTFSRKAQEIFLAWHLEKTLTKDRILEIYFNIIEFGPGIHGITLAARHFFNKHPFDLSLKEATWLASVLPAPVSRYRYFCNGVLTPGYDELMNTLLRRMHSLGRISRIEFDTAIAESLSFSEENRATSISCANNRKDTAQESTQ
jgi:hypothetical protein